MYIEKYRMTPANTFKTLTFTMVYQLKKVCMYIVLKQITDDKNINFKTCVLLLSHLVKCMYTFIHEYDIYLGFAYLL